jgi:hypothetical protein
VNRWRTAVQNPSVRILLVCAGITGAHLAFRLSTSDVSAAAIQVSQLPVGASVALSALPDGDPLETSCRMVVSFSPDCPFCKLAANREREGTRAAPFASVTWVTDNEAPSLGMFVGQLSPRSSYVVNRDFFQQLGVRAVPGLFLIDAQERLRWVGPYRGDEPESLLRERCSRALSQSSD